MIQEAYLFDFFCDLSLFFCMFLNFVKHGCFFLLNRIAAQNFIAANIFFSWDRYLRHNLYQAFLLTLSHCFKTFRKIVSKIALYFVQTQVD